MSSVSPGVVSAALATLVRIEGSNFYGFASLELGESNAVSLDRDFEVLVGELSLGGDQVTLIDSNTLDITLPSGLPLGLHDVTVTNPSGRSDTLEDALRIVDDANLMMGIEDASGGDGADIRSTTLRPNQTVEMHAVGRAPQSGNFLIDLARRTSISGNPPESRGVPPGPHQL